MPLVRLCPAHGHKPRDTSPLEMTSDITTPIFITQRKMGRQANLLGVVGPKRVAVFGPLPTGRRSIREPCKLEKPNPLSLCPPVPTGASSGTPAGLKDSRLSSFERAPCAPEPRFGRRAVYSSRAQRSVWKNQQSHAKIPWQEPLVGLRPSRLCAFW